MKALRNKKKDARAEGEKKFVEMFLKEIDARRDEIAKKIDEERPRIREMSTMKPLDGLRRLTI